MSDDNWTVTRVWAAMSGLPTQDVDPATDVTPYCEICGEAEASGMTAINGDPDGEWLATCGPCAAPYLPKRAPRFPRRYRNHRRG